MRLLPILLLGCCLCSCVSKNVTINRAIVVDLVSEEEIQLTAHEVNKLEDLLSHGLKWTFGKKWQVGNLIKVESTEVSFKIYLYKGGYLAFSTAHQYYKVKRKYLWIFNELDRGIEKGEAGGPGTLGGIFQ